MFTSNAIHIETSDGEEQTDANDFNEEYDAWDDENWYTKDGESGVWQEDNETFIFDESLSSDREMAITELESLSLDNREPTNNDEKQSHVSNIDCNPDGGEEAPSSLELKLPTTTAISMDLASQQELTNRPQERSRGHN